jgi:hypothetical protein
MKTRINIQRDVESRKNIAQATQLPAKRIETIVEAIKTENNAESEINPGSEDNAESAPGEKPKKRKRTSAGDV